MHKTEWEPPFTVQVRLKVDDIAGIALKSSGEKIGLLPKVSCFFQDEVGIQFVLDLNEITTWYNRGFYVVDTTAFHTYTIVVNRDRSGEVYIDNNFAAPALRLRPDEATFIPGSRLEIGVPTHSISKMTIDWVCYTQGVVLGLASVPDWIEVEGSSILST